MLSETRLRWCGVVTALGGLLFVTNGIGQLVDAFSFDALFFSMPLFGLSLLGLRGRIGDPASDIVRIAGGIGWVAVASAAISLVAGALVAVKIFLLDAVPYSVWPVHVATLVALFPLTVIGGAILGVAALRSRALPLVPLALGVFWLPLFFVGEAAGDLLSPDREIGLGFVTAGLGWIALGYVIWVGQSEPDPAHRPQPAGISTPR